MADTPTPHPAALRTAEWRCLLGLSAPGNTGPIPDDVDWPSFGQLCRRHRIFPLISDSASLGQADRPKRTLEQLQQASRRNTLKALRMTAELGRILTMFERANIRAMPIKGLSLAQRVYGSTARRYCGDIDLLIRASAWPVADQLLRDSGYQRGSPSTDFPSRAYLLMQRSRHDAEYFHPKTRFRVELHWRWLRDPNVLPVGSDPLPQDPASIRLGQTDVFIPNPETEFLHLCAHGVRHRWARFMWLNDIRWLLASGPDMAGKELDWHVISQSRDHSVAVTMKLLQMLGESLERVPLERLPGWNCQRVERLAQRCLQRLTATDDNVNRTHRQEWQDEWALARSPQQFIGGHVRYRVLAPSDQDVMSFPVASRLPILYTLLRPLFWLQRKVGQ